MFGGVLLLVVVGVSCGESVEPATGTRSHLTESTKAPTELQLKLSGVTDCPDLKGLDDYSRGVPLALDEHLAVKCYYGGFAKAGPGVTMSVNIDDSMESFRQATESLSQTVPLDIKARDELAVGAIQFAPKDPAEGHSLGCTITVPATDGPLLGVQVYAGRGGTDLPAACAAADEVVHALAKTLTSDATAP